MFERFTGPARQVVVNAQQEARELKHNYIGTEHILLGLTKEQGLAAQVLDGLGVARDRVREQILAIVGSGEKDPSGHIPFTPRAKKVLELSLREALQFKHKHIGTEHILLGLVREGEGVAAQVLVQLGAELADVRREVTRRLEEGADDTSVQTSLPVLPHAHTPAAAEVLVMAEQLAGGSPIGSHHLLEALARSHRSVAAHALTAAGVDVEVLAAALDDIELAGTTDLTPEEEAARQLEIRLEGEEVHVVLRDTGTVERVRAVTEQLGGPVRGTDPVAGGLAAVHQAVVRYLERLQRRVDPGPDDPAGDEPGHGTSSMVRRAVRSRLRRRRR